MGLLYCTWFVLLDTKPLENREYVDAIVEFCAGRISAEFERFLFQEEEAVFTERLEDSERRFSAIFDQTYQAIFIVDTDGRGVDEVAHEVLSGVLG